MYLPELLCCVLCVHFLNCSVVTAVEIGWGLLWMYGTELRVKHKPGFVLSCTVIDERIKTQASNNEFPVWILRDSVYSVLQSYFIGFLNNRSVCCVIGSFVRPHESLELSRMRFDSPVEHSHIHSLSPTPASRAPSEFLLFLLFWRNIFGKKDSQVSG